VLRMTWRATGHRRWPCPRDFFCRAGRGTHRSCPSPLSCPYGGMNCYFPMAVPYFCPLSLENWRGRSRGLLPGDYALCEVPPDMGYFHATGSGPTRARSQGGVHTILEGAAGRGVMSGTYMASGSTPGLVG